MSPTAETTTPNPLIRRSGGPQSTEGKLASRRNRLSHALRAKVVLPDDLAALVAERKAKFFQEIDPRSAREEFLVTELALAAAKLERCAELDLANQRRRIARAETFWDDDRRLRVDELAARLPRAPNRIARALAGSKQGAEWLIERWEGLSDVLNTNGGWDEAQRRLAMDLLGIPLDLRNGCTKLPVDSGRDGLAALITAQLERLRDDREMRLDDQDEFEQALACEGLSLDEDAASGRLRRYESECRRTYRWALAELRRVQAGRPEKVAAQSGSEPRRELEPFGLNPTALDYLATRVEERAEAELEAALALCEAEVAGRAEPQPAPPPSPAPVPAPAPRPAAEAPQSVSRLLVPTLAVRPSLGSYLGRPEGGNRRERRAQRSIERQNARRTT